MSNTLTEIIEAIDLPTIERSIRFVQQIAASDVVLMTFRDPAPSYAIEATSATAHEDDSLDVVLLRPSAAPQATPSRPGQSSSNRPEKSNDPPVFIKYRGVELTWRPGCATLQCDPDQAESLLLAVIEFAHYERELRRTEDEIVGAWPEVEHDKALAFNVTSADLHRDKIVGGSMDRAFQRRIRYARIEPHLYEPSATLPSSSQKLGVELREKARIEARLETVDAQIEVFEHIYEMAAQRMGEYRAAHHEIILEWIIIILLAAETALVVAMGFLKP
jgi:hypothetical protein